MAMKYLLDCCACMEVDFVQGQGPYLWTAGGERYVDMEAGSWAVGMGHCEPRVAAIIAAQASTLAHVSVRMPGALADKAAADFLAVTGIESGKCVFLSSGSEAVEFGVQAARRLSARPLMLKFSTSYLAAFGSAAGARPSEWATLDWKAAMADPDEALRSLPWADIGGFALETGGASPEFVRFPPASLVSAIVDRIRAAGGLVVANEITTGMGRTGRWFGYQHYGIEPDIVAAGKCLGNGYPVSAVAMTPDVAARLESGGLKYAQSHQNDPLGCAVASGVIKAMRDDGLVDCAAESGAFFLQRLRDVAAVRPAIKEVRGRGMLIGIELRQGGPDGERLRRGLWDRGFLVSAYPEAHPAGTGIRIDPPLNLPREEMERFAQALDECLADMT